MGGDTPASDLDMGPSDLNNKLTKLQCSYAILHELVVAHCIDVISPTKTALKRPAAGFGDQKIPKYLKLSLIFHRIRIAEIGIE